MEVVLVWLEFTRSMSEDIPVRFAEITWEITSLFRILGIRVYYTFMRIATRRLGIDWREWRSCKYSFTIEYVKLRNFGGKLECIVVRYISLPCFNSLLPSMAFLVDPDVKILDVFLLKSSSG